MKRLMFYVLTTFTLLSYAQKSSLVNPFVGTDAHGHTYPGVTAPWGMVQLSPDTRLSGWDGCSGYHYSDSVIYGFSHTHLSGTGCEDLCDILFTPTVHSRTWKDYTLKFSHKNELACAGFYSVIGFNKDFIKTELASTERIGHHNYTYPVGDTMAMVINLKHRDKTLDYNVEIRDDNTVLGYRKSKSWNEQQSVYFAVRFSTSIHQSYLNTETGELYLYFGQSTGTKHQVYAQTALSSVDKEGALKNLQRGLLKNFKDAKKQSIALWEKALGAIDIEGGTKEQRRTFYTALYHCMTSPNLYSDVDYRYRSMINNNLQKGNSVDGIKPADPIATADGYNRYTVFSLWDTYRTLNPLMTIIRPDKCLEFEKTFLDYYRQTDELPVWELYSWETYCMIGQHGISTLAEWILKGITVDNETALKAMISAANKERAGLDEFNRNGYISSEKEHESVSKTVEYAYNMYCIAQVAKAMGKDETYNEYIKRAQYYKNLFNNENKFIQPKENGRFLPDFDPKQVDVNYTEGNGWHYTFYAPQDINTLIALTGGKKAFEEKLDECFNSQEQTTGRIQADITGLIGQYAHGNEPSQHTAYLYNYINKPFKTQKTVRKILTELYSDKPDGICGNDDCGQMSAWYVMSAMGIYPVNPVSGEYVIGSPLFDKVTVHMPNGKDFVIKSKQGKDTPYVKSMKLNGKKYEKLFISHKDIVNGGTLEMHMTDEGHLFKSEAESYKAPVSMISDNLITPVAYLKYDGTGTFTDKLNVQTVYPNPDFTSFRTENRILTQTDSITVVNRCNAVASKPVTARFYKIPKGRSVDLLTQYNPQYTAGGKEALIDLKTGTDNWRLGCWQGYWGEDVEAVVDLGKVQNISYVGGHFIQDMKSWIFMPQQVRYYISQDGENYSLLGAVDNDTDPKYDGCVTKTFDINCNAQARYVKMKAVNIKTVPSWHISAGEKAWLFIDEIFIR